MDTKIDKSEIVARLQDVMSLKKIKQKDLASIVGVSERTISRWMCGKSVPLDKNLRKISIALDINLNWLVTGKGEIQSRRRGAIEEIPDTYLSSLLELDPEVLDTKDHGAGQCPVVKAYDDLKFHLKFYCIHCREWHLHGRGGEEEPYQKGQGRFAGHRHTHCTTTNSPFQKNGVILEVVGKFSAKIKKKYKTGKALFCPKCRSYYSAAFNACECGYINKKRKTKYPEIAHLYQSLLSRNEGPSFPPDTPQGDDMGVVESPKTVTLVHEQPFGDASDDTERQKFNQDMISLLNMITKWQEDENGADSLTSMNFLAEFHKRFPELQEWIKKQKGADHTVSGGKQQQTRKTA